MPHTHPYVFIGYPYAQKAYKVLNLTQMRLLLVATSNFWSIYFLCIHSNIKCKIVMRFVFLFNWMIQLILFISLIQILLLQ